MKYLVTVAIACCISATTIAQENANQKAIAHQQTLGYFGSFNHKPDDIHNISVSYSFTPRVPTTEIDYMLYSSAPRPLSFKIFNAAGKVVKEYKPTEEQSRHKGNLNVSDLPKGKYEYRIYWGADVAHKISFEKK